MNIESIDFFYLSMPEILNIGDGSQDALLVRVRAGGYEGWGECEASPLVSIAALVCPMSHSACKPVSASLLGQPINQPEDIYRLNRLVRANSFDLLQADHTLSGIDIALWDLLGKAKGQPVYRLLGYKKAYGKQPYASQLFADTPEETYKNALATAKQGFRAAKFSWGPYGRGTTQDDALQVRAAREGMGKESILCIDAGTVWGDDVDAAQKRLAALQECKVTWLEEPLLTGALEEYRKLSAVCGCVGLAAGEGCNNFYQAKNMMNYAGLSYIQIDTGRIGGISDAKRAADYSQEMGITYVNHTFTTHLALSASLQPYGGIESSILCEYPWEPKALAAELTVERLSPREDGRVYLPEKPGLGISPDLNIIKKYLVEVEINVKGKTLYSTPSVE